MSLFHTEGRKGREDRFFKTEVSKGSKVGVSATKGAKRQASWSAASLARPMVSKGNRWSGLKSVGSL
jgi:hypothetical protein